MTHSSDAETRSGYSQGDTPDDLTPRRPAWIETVPEAEAEGELAELYRRFGFPVAHVLRVSSVNPPVLRAHYELYRAIMHGRSPLTRVQREMIATVVSLLNQCHYWIRQHGEALRQQQGGDSTLLRALLEDFHTAPLPEAERRMLAYAERLTRDPSSVSEDQIHELRAIGWSDRAIHDMAQAIAYYNYVNRVVDGLGVTLEEGWPDRWPQ